MIDGGRSDGSVKIITFPAPYDTAQVAALFGGVAASQGYAITATQSTTAVYDHGAPKKVLEEQVKGVIVRGDDRVLYASIPSGRSNQFTIAGLRFTKEDGDARFAESELEIIAAIETASKRA